MFGVIWLLGVGVGDRAFRETPLHGAVILSADSGAWRVMCRGRGELVAGVGVVVFGVIWLPGLALSSSVRFVVGSGVVGFGVVMLAVIWLLGLETGRFAKRPYTVR